jgi:hypothetical protein
MENSTSLETDTIKAKSSKLDVFIEDIPSPQATMKDLQNMKESLLVEVRSIINFNYQELYNTLIELRRERNARIKKNLIVLGKVLALFNAGGLSWTFFINLFL